MKKSLILSVAIVLFLGVSSARANIFEEIGRTCPDPVRLSMVMWLPLEYFEQFAEHFPRGALEELEEMLDGHSLIAAVDGRVTPLGRLVYQTENDVRKDLAIIKDNDRHSPVPADDTPDSVRRLQHIMQDAWAQMMGEMGKNLRLYLFRVELDAAARGEFKVRLGGTNTEEVLFRYETPLRAVVPDTPCQECEYPVRAAWNFCPRCGKESKGADK